MKEVKREIKKGIDLHIIKTNSFKTDIVAVFLTTKLTREDVTKNALIPMILRRGSKRLKTIEEINKELEEMYGAGFDCGIDKTGDNQVLKFYLETIDNKYLPQEEELTLRAVRSILELVFEPKLENNVFDQEYVSKEKEKLQIIIEGKKDNKSAYANLRCQEEMYKGFPFGLYKYGYIEDLAGIDEKNLYKYYKKLISECKIDIFVSGDVNIKKIEEEIEKNANIQNLNEREAIYNKQNEILKKQNEKEIIEKADVTQGNLIIGLSIDENSKREKYVAMVYNGVLGGSPTSKMFQIVREKNSLAYTASSNFLRHKNSIFIRCGIEIDNYEKTLTLIREQLEDMRKGNFTEGDIKNAKTGIIEAVKMIPDEQDTEITYYLGQELAEHKCEYDEYEKEINSVSKEEIIELGGKININTIYFLRN